MIVEMTYKDWINREFRLFHPSLIDDWKREKTFGTIRDIKVVSNAMKDTVHEHWEMEIEKIQNPFLRSAFETALSEINWYDLAWNYFEEPETY